VAGLYGNPGGGFTEQEGGPMCCEDAAAAAGFPASFCGGGGGSVNTCFANDPGMASTNRNDHYNWAQRQDGARLEANMRNKINLLFNCPSVTDDQLSSAFADFSVVIARYAQNAACFRGDQGVINTDWSAHKEWARTKSRDQLLGNLQWKMAAAFKCLNRAGQSSLFADSSVAAAKAPLAVDTNPPEVEEIPEEVTSRPRTGSVPPNKNTPPSVRPCSADEAAAFSQMIGSWKAGGPKITVGGSCEQATGTTDWAEYCGDPDNTSNAKYRGTFTGRMEGGSLQVNWDLPAQGIHQAFQGTASCELKSDGTLSCSGFRCGVGGRKQ
jgi:hypothetical protein